MQSGNQGDPSKARPPLDGEDRLFATAHLHSDLRGRSVRGGALTVASQAGRFALNTVSLMALARLLTPADFGLVAMVQPITGFVALFKDLGLTLATVQRADVDHGQVSTLFWINVLVSLLLTLIGVAIAPLVGLFYGDGRAVWITVALSATFLFGGLSAQHQALLQRQMRFGSIALAELGGLSVGIAAGILAAWRGMGYWSLVVMTAATGAANVALLWWQSGWRPGLPRRGTGVREMLRFGGGLTGFNIVNYLTRNADNVLVGRFLGSEALGYYSRAYSLLALPMRQINMPVTSVAVPALSRLRSQPERFRRYYLRVIQMMAATGMPLVVFTFVCADSLILLILGEQWRPCVAIFRALGPAAFFATFNVVEGLVYVPRGDTVRWFRWTTGVAPFYVLAFALGLRWGPVGVAVCYSAAMTILRVPGILYAYRGSPLRLPHLLNVLWRPAAASFSAGALLYPLVSSHRVVAAPLAAQVGGALAVYLALYLGVLALLPGGAKMLAEMRSIFSELRSGKDRE
ncbi:MAG: lipopolysaccharide biosynthesis protein [Armatimonadota bacterium]